MDDKTKYQVIDSNGWTHYLFAEDCFIVDGNAHFVSYTDESTEYIEGFFTKPIAINKID